MDLGLRTKKEEALTKGSRHFKEWLNHNLVLRQGLCNKKTRISITRKQGLCNQDITVSQAFHASCLTFSFHGIVTTLIWVRDFGPKRETSKRTAHVQSQALTDQDSC